MPINPINVGTAPNNETGEGLRIGGQKINANFTYLKQYVDALLQGWKWKNKVDVATTENITLSGEQTIDGVLTNISRVLVKNQTDATENGIYISGTGAWERSSDADTGEKLVNATVSVNVINSNEDRNWTLPLSDITLGTTEIIFVPFIGGTGVDQGTFDAAIQLINDTIDALTARVQALEDNPSNYELTAQAITDALTYTPANDEEVVKSVTAGTNVTIDNTDPQNPIISASGGGESGTTAPTELLSFTPNWQTGLTFNPNASWKYNGAIFSDSREVTLSAADPSLDRFDLFAVNLETGEIEVIEGTPANPAVEPSYDPVTHLAANFISVKAGATTPENVTGTPIYNENLGTGGGEWNATGALYFDFANTESPASGTLAIKTTQGLNNNQELLFTPPSPVTWVEAMEVSYKFKNITGGVHRWIITGNRSNGRQASIFVDVLGYSTSSTIYQSLSFVIPSSSIVEITRISLIAGQAGIEYFIDDVRLITGGGAVAPIGDYMDRRGSNLASDLSEAEKTVIKDKLGVTEGGGIQSVVAGTNITIDDTDPDNPVINSTGGGGSQVVVSTDSDNAISSGTDGGAYLNINDIPTGSSGDASTELNIDTFIADPAEMPLVMPSYDGNTQGIHPSVVDFGSTPFSGYRYWMAYTPYTNSTIATENPQIVASNDKINWVNPAGITNPIDTPSDGGYYSDTELVVGYDGKLYCYYRQLNGGTAKIHVKWSVDGITWSTRIQVLTEGYINSEMYSPSVIKKNDEYWMYYIADSIGTIRLSKTDDPLNFAKNPPVTCTVTGYQPGKQAWHLGILKVEENVYAIISTFNGSGGVNGDLKFGIVRDNTKFEFATKSFLTPGDNGWTWNGLYRGTFVIKEVTSTGIVFDLWYSGFENLRTFIYYTTGTSYFKSFNSKGVKEVVSQEHTLSRIDHDKVIEVNTPLKSLIKIPNHDNSDIPVGFETDVMWVNDGSVEFSLDEKVVLLREPNESLELLGKFSSIRIIKVGFNTWRKIGSFKQYELSNKIYSTPNTFIGNGSGLVPTKAVLATKLGITANDISHFEIVGTEVQARVNKDHTIQTDAFRSTTGHLITYYIDGDGRCKGILAFAFSGASGANMELTEIFFPGVKTVTNHHVFSSAPKIKKINFDSLTTLNSDYFFYHATLPAIEATRLEFPQLSKFTSSAFTFNNVAAKLETIYIGKLQRHDNVSTIGVRPGVDVYVGGNLATSNNGGIDAGIQGIINNGGNVIFVNNYLKPNFITDLTVKHKYLAGLQLGFTQPSSANTIKGYEVYVNGELNSVAADAENVFAVNLEPNTEYLVKVIPYDQYFNKSNGMELLATTASLSENTYSQTYEPEYELVLDKAIADGVDIPSATQRAIDNQRFINLKTESVLSEMDAFWFLKVNYPPFSLLKNFYSYNLANPNVGRLRKQNNEPLFIPGKGLKGITGKGHQVMTGFAPLTNAVKFLPNNGSMIFGIFEGPTSFTISKYLFGAGGLGGSDDVIAFGPNQLTTAFSRLYGRDAFWPTDAAWYSDFNAHYHVGDTTNSERFKNGVLQHTGTSNASGTTNIPEIALFGHNNNGTVADALTYGLKYIAFGSNLRTKQAVIYQILNDLY